MKNIPRASLELLDEAMKGLLWVEIKSVFRDHGFIAFAEDEAGFLVRIREENRISPVLKDMYKLRKEKEDEKRRN